MVQVERKGYSVESGDTLVKLGVLLKICPFDWDIEVLWSLIKRTNSKHPFKVLPLKFYILVKIYPEANLGLLQHPRWSAL